MSETKLKPCPFCGGKAKLRDLTQVPECWVECTECGARTRFFSNSEETAVFLWNTRLIEDEEVKYEPTSYSCRACKNATDKEIKRLREALEAIKGISNSMSANKATTFYSIGIYNICCDALEGWKE